MSKKTKFAVVGAGAAALAMGASAAFAGTLYPVAVGGSTAAGTHVITASTSAGVAFDVNHSGTTVSLSCASSGVSGSGNYVTSGTSVDPVATLGAVGFSTCTGPGGANGVTQLTPWYLEADSGATSGSNTVVGRVTNISARVSTSPIASVCSFEVEGEANATYNEATGVLGVHETGFTGNLYISRIISGCGGQLAVGDPANFNADYQIGTVDAAAFTANKINVG